MLKYAVSKMDFGRWDECPVVDLYHIKNVGEISPTM